MGKNEKKNCLIEINYKKDLDTYHGLKKVLEIHGAREFVSSGYMNAGLKAKLKAEGKFTKDEANSLEKELKDQTGVNAVKIQPKSKDSDDTAGYTKGYD